MSQKPAWEETSPGEEGSSSLKVGSVGKNQPGAALMARPAGDFQGCGEPRETALQRNLPLKAAVYSLQDYSSRGSNSNVQFQSRKQQRPSSAVGRNTGMGVALGWAGGS